MRNFKQEFIDLRLIVEEASSNGDYKKNNQAMKSLQMIFKHFEKDTILAEEVLKDLLNHENDCVRSGAAANCLSLKILVTQAENTLIEVANNSKNRIIAFNAKSTLEVWHNQGYLKMYPKQKLT